MKKLIKELVKNYAETEKQFLQIEMIASNSNEKMKFIRGVSKALPREYRNLFFKTIHDHCCWGLSIEKATGKAITRIMKLTGDK